MLMPLPELVEKWNMDIRGVLHCGAHLAEEAPQYEEVGAGKVWWVEANPEVVTPIGFNLSQYPNQTLIQGLLWSEPGITKTFHVTNYLGMSSSLLEFGTHPTFSPDTVFVNHIDLTTTTIDTLVEENEIEANFLSLDLQGVELEVLKGAKAFLRNVNYIVSEVNDAEVYVGCAKVWELDKYLKGFKRVDTHMVPGQGWGDALWIREILF